MRVRGVRAKKRRAVRRVQRRVRGGVRVTRQSAVRKVQRAYARLCAQTTAARCAARSTGAQRDRAAAMILFQREESRSTDVQPVPFLSRRLTTRHLPFTTSLVHRLSLFVSHYKVCFTMPLFTSTPATTSLSRSILPRQAAPRCLVVLALPPTPGFTAHRAAAHTSSCTSRHRSVIRLDINDTAGRNTRFERHATQRTGHAANRPDTVRHNNGTGGRVWPE